MVLTLLPGYVWVGHPGYLLGLSGSWRNVEAGGLGSLEESVATAGLRELPLFQGQRLWRAVLSRLE